MSNTQPIDHGLRRTGRLSATTLLFMLVGALAACRPATPVEIDDAVSVLVEQREQMTPRELDRGSVWVVEALYGVAYKSPYELPSGRVASWSVERVFDHIWYLPSTVGKTTRLLPQYDYDYDYALTVYDPFGREIFHREV